MKVTIKKPSFNMVVFLTIILCISSLANATRGRVQLPPKGLSTIEWNNIKQQINYSKPAQGSNFAPDAYIKASNTGAGDFFGYAIAISGNTMVVGAYGEDSISNSVDGEETNNLISKSGAAFVFVREQSGTWIKQAYLKASNSGANDQFGFSVAISDNLIVIGSPFEDSNSVLINDGQSNNDAANAGAAYVFNRVGSTWSQQAYLKAANAEDNDQFGHSVGIDGNTVVVGARFEDSIATGVNNINSNNNDALRSGAAYVYTYNSNAWIQQAYLKAPNTGANDFFGNAVDISGDSLIVGALNESSSAVGVNGNGLNDNANSSGAAYVYTRTGITWATEAYLKASNTGSSDLFGFSVAISSDYAVVGSPQEDSSATGVNGSQNNNTAGSSGAAYVFNRMGSSWSQQAYLKSLDSSATDYFGASVNILDNTLVVGAYGDNLDTGEPDAGAAFVFTRNNFDWSQQAYLKSSVRDESDFMGQSVALSDEVIIVGAFSEDSNSTGVNNDNNNNSALESGAVYTFNYEPTYNIGGNVSGLASGNSVVLRNNNGDDLSITENGSFAFLTQLPDSSGFAVTVEAQPTEPNQTCQVTGGNSATNNGSGNVSSADITSIVVTCTIEQYSIGGTLTGLSAGSVVLQNNLGNNLTLNQNGDFVFSVMQDDSSGYDVTVLTSPTSPEHTCALSNNRGSVSGMNVTTVLVECNTAPTTTTDFYNIAEDTILFATDVDGTATGTNRDNGIFVNDIDADNDTLTVVSPGTYTADGIGGNIQIFADGGFKYIPPNNISGEAGFIFDVTDGIHITSSKIELEVYALNDAPSFSIIGDIDIHGQIPNKGTAIIDNFAYDFMFGADDEQTTQSVQQFNINISSDSNGILDSVLMSNDGHLQLDFSLNSGVAILQINMQDDGGSSDGGVDTSQTLEFSVSNVEGLFSVGGNVSGLVNGNTVILRNSGTDDLSVIDNGSFTFLTKLTDLSSFAVTVATHPSNPNQTCQITGGNNGNNNGSGTISAVDVSNIVVDCNTVPTITNDFYISNEDTTLIANDVDGTGTGTDNDNSVLVNDTDVESDPLTVVSPGIYTANGIGGEIEIFADGQFIYTPPANTSGQDRLIYDITDGFNTSSSELIINVAAINDAPSFSIVGDIDATGLFNFDNPTVTINDFAYDFMFGADDEQITQSVQQFNISISSDSNGILDSVLMSNDGHLQLDFSLNSGVAILHISMQDDGGSSDGGIDTSQTLEFSVSNTDMIYASGFESGGEFRVLDFIKKVNHVNQSDTLEYDFNSDSLFFDNHQIQLFDDYGSAHAMKRIKLWISELILLEQYYEEFIFDK